MPRKESKPEIFDRHAQLSLWLARFCAERLDSSGSHSILTGSKGCYGGRIFSCCLGLNGSRQLKPSHRALARADLFFPGFSGFNLLSVRRPVIDLLPDPLRPLHLSSGD